MVTFPYFPPSLDLHFKPIIKGYYVYDFTNSIVSNLGKWCSAGTLGENNSARTIPLGQSGIGKSFSGSFDVSHVSSWEEVEAVHQNCLASEWPIIISNSDRN